MLLEILERRLLFQPRPVGPARPTDLGMDYEESWAETPDGRLLHCWHIPGDTRPGLTWLWFGGAGGNLSRRVGEFSAVRQHTGANIFGFDYAGFGNSAGKASVRRTAVDARAALAHLQLRHGVRPETTLLPGRLLGRGGSDKVGDGIRPAAGDGPGCALFLAAGYVQALAPNVDVDPLAAGSSATATTRKRWWIASAAHS